MGGDRLTGRAALNSTRVPWQAAPVTHESSDLTAALDAIPTAFVVIDGSGRFAYVHPRAAEWDRTPPRIRSGRDVPEDFPGWLDEGHATELRAAIRSRAAGRWSSAGAREGVRLETACIPVASGILLWVTESVPSPAGTPGPDRRIIHDLMQPLGAITNYAELIRQQTTDRIQKHAAEIVRISRQAADRLREKK
jgi:hypothetical protein